MILKEVEAADMFSGNGISRTMIYLLQMIVQ